MVYIVVAALAFGSLIEIFGFSPYHYVYVGCMLILTYKYFKNTDHKQRLSDIKNIYKSPILFFAVWLIYAGISVLWAPDKGMALKTTYYIGLILCTCLIFLDQIDDWKKIEKFSAFAVYFLLLLNCIAVFEILSGIHNSRILLETAKQIKEFKHVFFLSFKNQNDASTFVFVLSIFSFYNMFKKDKKILAIISMINIVLAHFVIRQASSRAVMMAFYLLFIIVIITLLITYWKEVLKKRRMLLRVVTVILAIVVTVYLLPLLPFMHMVPPVECGEGAVSSVVKEQAVQGSSANIRLNLILNSLLMVKDSFGFGVGAKGSAALMNEYSTMYYSTVSKSTEVVILNPHNFFAELLADYGILMFCLFGFVIIRMLISLIKISKKVTGYKKLYGLLLVAATISFAVASMSSSSIIPLVSLWISCAFVIAFENTLKLEITEIKQ